MLPKGGGRKREREELVAWWYSESNNFRGMRGGDSRRAPTSPVVYLRRRERSCETFPYVFKRCWRAYLRRFDIEHTFRFIKNTLGWTTPSLCTPEQADCWSWLIVGALTQLRLARGLVDDLRLPWERPLGEAKLTPTRVRRGFRRLRPTIGTPASPPKSTTPGPGRPKGTRKPPRKRYPAVKKAA